MIPTIDVDLEAIEHNYRAFADAVGVAVMPIVKASGYGHGALPVARTVAAAGAKWIGVADASEGIALRAAGLDTRILTWLHSAGETWESVIAGQLDIAVSSMEQLAVVAAAAEDRRRGSHAATVDVHLKLDTGLGRNGAPIEEWRTLFAHARDLERGGRIHIAGMMSHISGTSADDDLAQVAQFDRAREIAAEVGLHPQLLHLAATGAALKYPQARYDLVRLGISLYGLAPDTDGTADALGLRPALRLRAPIRRLEGRWAVGVGQGDGLPPLRGELPPLIDDSGEQWRIDEVTPVHLFVSPLGEAPDVEDAAFAPDASVPSPRQLTVIARPGEGGATADDWAAATQTINYEVTTRLTGRIAREYTPALPSDDARRVAWPPIEDPGRAVTAPQRQAVIDLELLARRLQRLARRAATVGANRRDLAYAVDVSSDAYGHGLAEVLPFIRDTGLPIVVRTRNDLEALRLRGVDGVLAPDAPTSTRAVYGLDPADPLPSTLSLRSELIGIKRVQAGQHVSYGYQWEAKEPTTLGLLPIGYADALPRAAFGHARVTIGGWQVPVVGRIAMDQVVLDLGDFECWPGMRVQVWGNEGNDVKLSEWASWTGWAPESLCANLGERVERIYTGRKTSGFRL